MQAHLQWLHRQLAITLHVRHDIVRPSLHPPDAAFGLYLTGTPNTLQARHSCNIALCVLSQHALDFSASRAVTRAEGEKERHNVIMYV